MQSCQLKNERKVSSFNSWAQIKAKIQHLVNLWWHNTKETDLALKVSLQPHSYFSSKQNNWITIDWIPNNNNDNDDDDNNNNNGKNEVHCTLTMVPKPEIYTQYKSLIRMPGESAGSRLVRNDNALKRKLTKGICVWGCVCKRGFPMDLTEVSIIYLFYWKWFHPHYWPLCKMFLLNPWNPLVYWKKFPLLPSKKFSCLIPSFD